MEPNNIITKEEQDRFNSGKMSIQEIVSYNQKWCTLNPDPWMDEPLTPEEEEIFNSADDAEIVEVW
jgi:hypothetical protein